MDFNGIFDSTFLLTLNKVRASCEETTQNSLTMLPNMMGMFGREAATPHFSIGYHQNHFTASFNLNQLELFTKKKLTRFLLHRRMFPSGNTQRVQALLLTE
jgi:hypothetical protein